MKSTTKNPKFSEITSKNEKRKVKPPKIANFHYEVGIESFDFSSKEFGIIKNQMKQLLEFTWLEKAYNVMFWDR